MRDYFDLKNLPILEPYRRTLQVSSFDRKADKEISGSFISGYGRFMVLLTNGERDVSEVSGRDCNGGDNSFLLF